MNILKIEGEDLLVTDDDSLRIKMPKDINVKPSLLVIILDSPAILYQYHGSMFVGHQGITKMHLTVKGEVLC